MSFDYDQIICEAIDTIVTKKLESISFDRTILCTIVDNSAKESGMYTVSDGSVKFTAYSSDTTFLVNTNVYVQIPNGDWDQQKFIIGKKKSKDTTVATYNNPFQQFIDITGNVIVPIVDNSLIANHPNELSKVIWNYDIKTGDIPLAGFTRLGLQAQFQSWLDGYELIAGNYGLRLKLNRNDSGEWDYVIVLDTNDMNGDPYNFESYFQQEIVVDISGLSTINSMMLEFFQDNDFVNKEGEKVPYKDEISGDDLFPNLFVKDVYLSFGYDVSEYNDGKLSIYSADGIGYGAENTKNIKEIKARWLHKDENGNFEVVDINDNLEYELRWYRYKLGASSADQYSGQYWIRLSTQKAIKYGELGIQISYEINDNDWIIYNSNPENVSLYPDFFTTYCIADVENQEEKIKAVVIIGNKIYESNEITFLNEVDTSKKVLSELNALNIYTDDDTFGNYRIYNLGNSLIRQRDAQIIRNFKLSFRDSESQSASDLTKAEKIEWIIPTKNTMIILDTLQNTSQVIEDSPLKGYKTIVRLGDEFGNIDSTQPFRIKSYYSQGNNNNTIQCRVVRNGIVYTAIKDLTFGVQGTTGTDYTFVLDYEDSNKAAITVGDSEYSTIVAKLYDYNNQEIEVKDKTIEWVLLNSSLVDLQTVAEPHKANIKVKASSLSEIELKQNYSILQATLKGWGDYDLVAYLPIAIRTDNKYLYIDGPTYVFYDTAGMLNDYTQVPYRLFKDESIEIASEWSMGTTEAENFQPTLKENLLRPKNFYVEGTNKEICVVAKDLETNEFAWSQPLLFLQNRYPAKMINDWDGKLEINQEENYIFTATIAAGKKDENNTFTGVLMGDYGVKEAEGSISKLTGIYGYRKGLQTFAFREDGTAFIGIDTNKGGNIFTVTSSGSTILDWKVDRIRFSAGFTLPAPDYDSIDNLSQADKEKYKTNDKIFCSDYVWGYDKDGNRLLYRIKHTQGYLYGYDYKQGNRKTLIRTDGVLHTKVENNIKTTDSKGQSCDLDTTGEFYVGMDGQMYSSMGKFGGNVISSRWRIGDELQCWYKGYGPNIYSGKEKSGEGAGVFAIGPKGYMGSFWKNGNVVNYIWRITSNGTAYFQNIRTGTNANANIKSANSSPWYNTDENYIKIKTSSEWENSDVLRDVELNDDNSLSNDNFGDIFSDDYNEESGTIITPTMKAEDVLADEIFTRALTVGFTRDGEPIETPEGDNTEDTGNLTVANVVKASDYYFSDKDLTDSLYTIIKNLQNEIADLKKQLNI